MRGHEDNSGEIATTSNGDDGNNTRDSDSCDNKNVDRSMKRRKRRGHGDERPSKTMRKMTPQTRAFTSEDDQQMLNYLIRTNSIPEALNISTWLGLEQEGSLFPHRAGPLFMHFTNNVLPNYKTYKVSKEAYHQLEELRLLQTGFPMAPDELPDSVPQSQANGVARRVRKTPDHSLSSGAGEIPKTLASQFEDPALSKKTRVHLTRLETSLVPPVTDENSPESGENSPEPGETTTDSETQFSPGDKSKKKRNRSPAAIKSERLTPKMTPPPASSSEDESEGEIIPETPTKRRRMNKPDLISSGFLQLELKREEPAGDEELLEGPGETQDPLLNVSSVSKRCMIPGGNHPYVEASSDSRESAEATGELEKTTDPFEACGDPLGVSGELLVSPQLSDNSQDGKRSRRAAGRAPATGKSPTMSGSSPMSIDSSHYEESQDLRMNPMRKNIRSRNPPVAPVPGCSRNILSDDESEDSEIERGFNKNRKCQSVLDSSPETPAPPARRTMRKLVKRMIGDDLPSDLPEDVDEYSPGNSPGKISKSPNRQKGKLPVKKSGKNGKNSVVEVNSSPDMENSPPGGARGRGASSPVIQKGKNAGRKPPGKSQGRKFLDMDSDDSNNERNVQGRERGRGLKRNRDPDPGASTSRGVKGYGFQRGERGHVRSDSDNEDEEGGEAQWARDRGGAWVEPEVVLVEGGSEAEERERHQDNRLDVRVQRHEARNPGQPRVWAGRRSMIQLGDALGRRAFTPDEDQAMVDALIEHNLIYRATSMGAWQGLLAMGVPGISSRTAKSLRNHFSNYVRWNYRDFTNDPDVIAAFEDAERRRENRQTLRKTNAERKKGSSSQ